MKPRTLCWLLFSNCLAKITSVFFCFFFTEHKEQSIKCTRSFTYYCWKSKPVCVTWIRMFCSIYYFARSNWMVLFVRQLHASHLPFVSFSIYNWFLNIIIKAKSVQKKTRLVNIRTRTIMDLCPLGPLALPARLGGVGSLIFSIYRL